MCWTCDHLLSHYLNSCRHLFLSSTSPDHWKFYCNRKCMPYTSLVWPALNKLQNTMPFRLDLPGKRCLTQYAVLVFRTDVKKIFHIFVFWIRGEISNVRLLTCILMKRPFWGWKTRDPTISFFCILKIFGVAFKPSIILRAEFDYEETVKAFREFHTSFSIWNVIWITLCFALTSLRQKEKFEAWNV